VSDIVAIKSAISLLLLALFVQYLWRDYRIDAFRDHVFSIRDRLFMYAATGGVAFDHPAYTILRNRMNVMLRYGHEFTLFRLVAVALFHRGILTTKSRDFSQWEEALGILPFQTALKLREFNTILAISILQLVIYRSFILYVIIRPLMPFVPTRDAFHKSPAMATCVEQLESEALEEDAQRNCDELVSA
jgi:hypothetical protein